MDYLKTIEEYFWDNLEGDELVINDENLVKLEEAVRLLEIEDPSIANKEIDSSDYLKNLFNFDNLENINVIDGFSSDEPEITHYESSDS